jgi:CheY-like chemotaxis protein
MLHERCTERTPGEPRLPVLVVEDHIAVVRTMRRMFPKDLVLEHVGTKSAAIERLPSASDLRLVLVDLVLGKYSRAGLDILEVAETERPTVPRALVTASEGRTVFNHAAEHGALFIAKRFTPEAFRSLLGRARSMSGPTRSRRLSPTGRPQGSSRGRT